MNAPVITPSTAKGLVWRAIVVRHLTGAENAGKHNVFADCLINGTVVRDGSVQIKWGWEGQEPDEPSPNKVCDKKAPDYATDIPINAGQIIWCEALGHNAPSDRVSGLTADLPSDGPGNDWRHNSWYVRFELQMSIPPVPDKPEQGELEAMRADMQKISEIAGKWAAIKQNGWSWSG